MAVCAAAATVVIGGYTADQPAPNETATTIDLHWDANWADQMVTCMADAGWAVEIVPDGGISADFDENQFDAYKSALADCRAQHDGDVSAPDFTDPELRLLYQMTSETASCLVDQGYEITSKPSEQSFVDSKGSWDPYGDIWYPGTDLTSEEFGELLGICPRPGR